MDELTDKVNYCTHDVLKYIGTTTDLGRTIDWAECVSCHTSKLPSDRYVRQGDYYIRKVQIRGLR